MTRARNLSKFKPNTDGLVEADDLEAGIIESSLGYTPVDKDGDTLTGVLTFAAGQTFPGTGDVTTDGAQTLTNKTIDGDNNTITNVDLAGDVKGTLPVANGGTGATSLTGVLKGNGTDAVTAGDVDLTADVTGTLPVANGGTGLTSPGTAGNILVSNGTGFVSQQAPAGSGVVEAVASGTLPDGSTVVLNSDGTVSTCGYVGSDSPEVTTDQEQAWAFGAYYYIKGVYHPPTNQIIIFTNNSQQRIVATVGQINADGTITFSGATESIFTTADATNFNVGYDPTSEKVIVIFKNGAVANRVYAIVCTMGTLTLSVGTPVQVSTENYAHGAVGYDLTSGKVLIAYNTNVVVATVSGTTLSVGTPHQYDASALTGLTFVYDETNNKPIVIYTTSSNGSALICDVSGTSVTTSGGATFSNTATGYLSAIYDPVINKTCIAYRKSDTYCYAISCQISDGSIVFDTETLVYNTTAINYNVQIATSDGTTYIGFTKNSPVKSLIARADFSGSTASISTPVDITSPYETTFLYLVAGTDNSQYLGCFYAQTASVVYANVYGILETNLTTENFIGFSDGSYTDGQTATIQTIGSVNTAQSGLTTGATYYVQNDGTLATTTGDPSVIAGTAMAPTDILVLKNITSPAAEDTVLITTLDLTGASIAEFELPSGYGKFEFVFDNVRFSVDGGEIRSQYSTGGAYLTTTIYQHVILSNTAGSGTTSTESGVRAHAQLTSGTNDLGSGAAIDPSLYGNYTIYNALSSSEYKMASGVFLYGRSNSLSVRCRTLNHLESASVIDKIKFYSSSATFASGTIKFFASVN